MNRLSASKGYSIVELVVAVGIVLLLLAAATPFYNSYRGKSNVNRAVEVTKAFLERAGEEAKSAGYPLPQSMIEGGLQSPSPATQENQTVVLRIRKRLTAGGEAKLVAERHLPRSDSLKVALDGFGILPMTDTDAPGIYVEILQEKDAAETLVATLPIDVNGDFVFQGERSSGAIFFSYGSHVRGLQMNIRGAVKAEQR
jgi:Tfp pilus assembly protein PilE